MRTTPSIAPVFSVAQVWSITSGACMYTLEGHDKGVNCLDYYPGGEKPYLVSGADDKTVKVWDYQNKTCVQTLESHTQNVSVVAFHPELPVIISGSEDGASHFSKSGGQQRRRLSLTSLAPSSYRSSFPQAPCGSGTPTRTAWRTRSTMAWSACGRWASSAASTMSLSATTKAPWSSRYHDAI